ncbi:S1 RNA-binding domain-containing protein [Candidatus Peregrinibacteria bacterium]|jgi:small subunit ribosomal protein S1|nr:S1 RNA-binding domain-containing protein [Candidatus Peregrinibacteria bacterium]
MSNVYTDNSVMEELMKNASDMSSPVPGTLIDGVVISTEKNKVLVDLDGIHTGIITGQEAHDSAGTVKTLTTGDDVTAYVLEEENDDGLVVLSLKKASQQKTWNKFITAYENKESIVVSPNEANKGGLLLNVDGIKGFIPVSQLAPLHYPRVDGADSAQILARLQKLVSKPLTVKIINLEYEGGKMILSEKAAEADNRQGALDKLEVGQKLKGEISGIVKFGIFVTFDGLEGLVHISEIAWGHVKDPHDFGKLGNPVEVLVIGKEKDKISLSMKRLVPDPWIEATKKYKIGTVVEAEISRVTPFGAFIKLDEEINGLIHVSEISSEEVTDPADILKVGEKVTSKIIAIDPDDHRVALSIKALDEKASPKKEKKAEEEAEEEVKEESADEEEATE